MVNILCAESGVKIIGADSAKIDSALDSAKSDSTLDSAKIDSSDSTTDSAKSDSANFVLDSALLNKKTTDFINQTSFELFSKTGVKLYVFSNENLQQNNKSFETYEQFKSDLLKALNAPFVAIIAIKNNKKIDIIASNDEILSKDLRNKIYWEYIVPLLPKKDENPLLPAIFNGYVEAVDLIADNFGVTINHNISKDEKGANLVAKGILYAMLFSMLGLVAIIYLFRNKRISQ